jgi:hypothetical protein
MQEIEMRDLLAILGQKEVELAVLRAKLEQALAKLKELEPKDEK